MPKCFQCNLLSSIKIATLINYTPKNIFTWKYNKICPIEEDDAHKAVSLENCLASNIFFLQDAKFTFLQPYKTLKYKSAKNDFQKTINSWKVTVYLNTQPTCKIKNPKNLVLRDMKNWYPENFKSI